MSEQRTVTTCSCHCGGKCLIKVYTREAVVTRIEAVDGGDPQLSPHHGSRLSAMSGPSEISDEKGGRPRGRPVRTYLLG